MATEQPFDHEHQWKWLGNDLWRRTCAPIIDVSFVLYVLTAILGIGGLGIWVEVVKYAQSSEKNVTGIIIAMSAFFPALVGSAAFQLVLDSIDKKTGDKLYASKVLSSFAITSMVFFFGIDLLITTSVAWLPNVVLALATLSSMASVWIWWVANADQKTFLTKPSTPEDSSGGSVKNPLPGNTDGFKI